MTDSYDMFATLPGQAKTDLVRQVLDGVVRIDPDLQQFMSIRSQGKTVIVQTTVNGVPLQVHVTAPDAHTFLRNYQSLTSQPEKPFCSGMVDLNGIQTPAFLRQVGSITTVVYRQHDALMISLTAERAVPVPSDLRRGKKLPFELPDNDGFLLTTFEGQLMIVGSYRGLRKNEIRCAGKAVMSFGLVKLSPDTCIIGLKVPGVCGWCDMPLAYGLESPENWKLNPPDVDGTSKLLLILAERKTSIVEVLRTVRLSKEFTTALHETIEEQHERAAGMTRESYIASIEAYRRRRKVDDIHLDFTASCIAQ